MPSLTLRILQGMAAGDKPPFNLKAFAVGNGLSSYELNDDSTVWFAYHHGMVDEKLWNSLLSSCCSKPYTRQNCPFSSSKTPSCVKDFEQVMDVVYESGLNWYNIYGDCLQTTESGELDRSAFSHKKYARSMEHLFRRHREDSRTARLLQNLHENVPCIDSTGCVT